MTVIALTVLAWAGSGATARADGNAIRKALEALVPYDLVGDKTFDALAHLSASVEAEKDAKTRRGLSFVRAVALTDLWILAHKSSGTTLAERIARVMAVPQGEVPRVLLRTLEGIHEPVVEDILRDSRHALLLNWPEAGAQVSPLPVGPRTSVLYVDRVLAAFGPENSDSLPLLAAMADDPCPDISKCGDPYRAFDAQGRKAIRAVEIAIEVLGTLRDEVMVRDPFVQSIAPRIETDAVLLPGLEFTPSVALEQVEQRAHRTSQGSPATAEIVAFVSPGKLEVGFVPHVRVTHAGKLELVARGEPVLPALREVKFGSSFPLITRSIEELVSALSALHAQAPDARIAIAARPDSPAHLWARALLSAKASGFSCIAMLGVGRDGLLRSQDVEVVSPMQASAVGPMELTVMVRLGGFTVQRAGPSVSLPRLKGQSGFTFDYAGLQNSARASEAKSTKLTFMSDVEAQILAETAFLLAPKNSPLTVILP